jgi:hypothetical protein
MIIHLFSQFYGVFLSFHLGWKTDWLVQGQIFFSSHVIIAVLARPFFIIRRYGDFVATMYDVFHRGRSKPEPEGTTDFLTRCA